MRNWKLQMLLAVALLAAATMAGAQYPNRVIRLVVPYPAGGTTDIMARTLQEPLGKILGQPVIVDNKAGASGALGTREVARSAPDGYNLIFSNNGPGAIAPLVQKDAGYDPIKDFAPVSLVSVAPLFLVVHSSVPVQDVKGLIEFARTSPQNVEYSTAGSGSLGHLSTERFARAAGIKLLHIPYKGAAPSTLAVIAGEVKMLLTASSEIMKGSIKAGKVKLLAVSSSKPSALAPGTPTISETLPDFVVEIWFGILAPAGTPPEVIAKLNDAIAKAVAQPSLQQRFAGYGVTATASTPKQFGDIVESEVDHWRQVLRDGNIRSDN